MTLHVVGNGIREVQSVVFWGDAFDSFVTSILVGFMGAMLGVRLVGRETDTSTGLLCIDNLESVLQRNSHSSTLHHGIDRPHRILLHVSETVHKMVVQ